MDTSTFSLGDFLSSAGNAYSTYQAGQNTANLATTQQQIALANASATASKSAASTKIALYIGGGLVALVLVIFLVKKLR